MTKHTAGILGSLTIEALRAMTDAELYAKAAAIESGADTDGFLSVADEADLCLITREQMRRDEAPPQPLIWFLATCRCRKDNSGAVVLLVQAKAGAEVEEEVGRHGIDARTHDISWSPLDACTYGKIGLIDDFTVVPAAR